MEEKSSLPKYYLLEEGECKPAWYTGNDVTFITELPKDKEPNVDFQLVFTLRRPMPVVPTVSKGTPKGKVSKPRKKHTAAKTAETTGIRLQSDTDGEEDHIRTPSASPQPLKRKKKIKVVLRFLRYSSPCCDRLSLEKNPRKRSNQKSARHEPSQPRKSNHRRKKWMKFAYSATKNRHQG